MLPIMVIQVELGILTLKWIIQQAQNLWRLINKRYILKLRLILGILLQVINSRNESQLQWEITNCKISNNQIHHHNYNNNTRNSNHAWQVNRWRVYCRKQGFTLNQLNNNYYKMMMVMMRILIRIFWNIQVQRRRKRRSYRRNSRRRITLVVNSISSSN